MRRLFLFLAVSCGLTATAQPLPYKNPQLTAHERAVDLCGRLTLEEKAKLMLDESPAIPRLGIKKFFLHCYINASMWPLPNFVLNTTIVFMTSVERI